MVEDTLEDALGDDDELEDDAAEEVDKVLFELTAGKVILVTFKLKLFFIEDIAPITFLNLKYVFVR